MPTNDYYKQRDFEYIDSIIERFGTDNNPFDEISIHNELNK